MPSVLYHAHSGIRYLVLAAALAALVLVARGLSGRAPYSGAARAAVGAFVGLLHLQLLLGILLVVSGIWYPALMGHLVMMVLAVAAAQLLSGWARRAPDPARAYRLALAGVAVALLLIVAGIAAIGRHPLQSRAPSLAAER